MAPHILSSAVDGGERSAPSSGRFTPGKEVSYPMITGLGEPQSQSGGVGEKSVALPGFEPLPQFSQCTACAVPLPNVYTLPQFGQCTACAVPLPNVYTLPQFSQCTACAVPLPNVYTLPQFGQCTACAVPLPNVYTLPYLKVLLSYKSVRIPS